MKIIRDRQYIKEIIKMTKRQRNYKKKLYVNYKKRITNELKQ